MREKLKNLGIRLTELSNYLGCSRPTLYKYLEDYENRNYKNIDSKVRKVFDLIIKKKTLSKIEVINFIIGINKENDETLLDELFKIIKADDNLQKDLIQNIEENGIDDIYKQIKKIFSKGDK